MSNIKPRLCATALLAAVALVGVGCQSKTTQRSSSQYSSSSYYGAKPSQQQSTFGDFTSRGTSFRSDSGPSDIFTGSRWRHREIER